MNYELILTLIGLMLLAYWFAYVTGSPMADSSRNIDGKAILSVIPYQFAINRLARAGMWKGIYSNFLNELSMTSDPRTREEMKRDHRAAVIEAGRTFFSWERSILCPICFHFWLTILVGFIFILFDIMHARADLFLAAFVYLVNHLIIRKIA